MSIQNTIRIRSRAARSMSVLATTMLLIGLVAACGDDDDGVSAQEKYCEAGESLEASVGALSSVELVAGGVDGLESALGAVEDDLKDLRDAATDAVADDIDVLEESVDDLSSALSDLGGEITSDNAAAVGTAVEGVAAAALGVWETLDDCG